MRRRGEGECPYGVLGPSLGLEGDVAHGAPHLAGHHLVTRVGFLFLTDLLNLFHFLISDICDSHLALPDEDAVELGLAEVLGVVLHHHLRWRVKG